MSKRKYVVLDLAMVALVVTLFCLWQKVEHQVLGGYVFYALIVTIGLLIYWGRLVMRERHEHQ